MSLHEVKMILILYTEDDTKDYCKDYCFCVYTFFCFIEKNIIEVMPASFSVTVV